MLTQMHACIVVNREPFIGANGRQLNRLYGETLSRVVCKGIQVTTRVSAALISPLQECITNMSVEATGIHGVLRI